MMFFLNVQNGSTRLKRAPDLCLKCTIIIQCRLVSEKLARICNACLDKCTRYKRAQALRV